MMIESVRLSEDAENAWFVKDYSGPEYVTPLNDNSLLYALRINGFFCN